jgi:DNA-directed RNA polymerase subunit beta'
MGIKAVQLLVNSALPPDLRSYDREMDSKSLGNLLADVARQYPDQFEGISKRLSDIGRKASYLQGETLTLNDMRPVFDRDKVYVEMDAKLAEARKSTTNEEDFRKKRISIWLDYSSKLEKLTSDAALKRGSNLAYSVMSGARGKPAQLKMMVTTPALYTDATDEVVPLFIRNSFGDGLRPAEYLAGTYGARKSVLATKRATAKGGDLAKQMVQATTPIVVSMGDCRARNGLDLDLDDKSLRGRVLAQPLAGMPAGTVIDRQAVAQFRKEGVKKIIARSPMTCQAEAGVCAKCMGLDAKGNFSPVGEAVGITASQAIGEPITQQALNTKHQGGAAGGAKREFTGFNYINQFVQAPEQFPDRATVAREEGKVTGVRDAPQGGSYIKVNNQDHYVAPGYPLMVKPGDKVEAGDQLSEGLIDPGEIVELRGLGSGRRYYRDRLLKMLQESGMPTDARNVELVSRAALDHVQIQDADEDDDFLPDDVLSYSYLQSKYNPPADAKPKATKDAVGQYLQAPALHYTIGTKLTQRMADRLSDSGMTDVITSNKAPKFAPQMVRLRSAAHSSTDWLASMHTSYLKKQIHEDAMRGRDTDIEQNIHFAPRLAIGVDFGKNVKETGKF